MLTPSIFHKFRSGLATIAFLAAASLAQIAHAEIDPFLGSYSGSAEVTLSDGSMQQRDMSVEITESKEGFTVAWTTITKRPDGRETEKSYRIGFVPGPRDGLYAAAQEKNLFGHDVQLDPMKGEPYVWSQIFEDTLTVYALFVDPTGGYVIQQYDRTLTEGGLQLEFNSVTNGEKQRTVSSFLKAE